MSPLFALLRPIVWSGDVHAGFLASLLALVLVGPALVACAGRSPSGTPAQIALHLVPPAPGMGPVTVQIMLQTAQGAPITGAKLQVRGDMTHAGMQPVLADATDQGGGRYVANTFHFSMAGDWVLTVSGALPDGTHVERTFPVNGVSGSMPTVTPRPTSAGGR